MAEARRWPLALLACLLGIASTGTPAAGTPDYTLRPVLFVHGSGENARRWRVMMRQFVHEARYPRAYLLAVDLRPPSGDNRLAAEQYIAPAVERLLAQAAEAAASASVAPPGRIDIVSHSMGAASARWYVARMHPERVTHWVSIAGAHHGTNALCGRAGEGDRQMCPAFADSPRRSPFQVALNGTSREPRDETPFGLGSDRREVESIPADAERRIVYWTIYRDSDEWIQPERSAWLDGTGGIELAVDALAPIQQTGPGRFVYRGRANHNNMPGDSALIRFVAQLLALEPPS